MSSNPIEHLLAEVFRAQGAVDPEGLAERAAKDFEMDQRDANIYELRATLPEKLVAERFGLSAIRVRQIVKDQHEKRGKMRLSA